MPEAIAHQFPGDRPAGVVTEDQAERRTNALRAEGDLIHNQTVEAFPRVVPRQITEDSAGESAEPMSNKPAGFQTGQFPHARGSPLPFSKRKLDCGHGQKFQPGLTHRNFGRQGSDDDDPMPAPLQLATQDGHRIDMSSVSRDEQGIVRHVWSA